VVTYTHVFNSAIRTGTLMGGMHWRAPQ
jgi:hypothetical protein